MSLNSTQKHNVTITQHNEMIDINGPENTAIARKINEDTWHNRYRKIISDAGYDTGNGGVLRALAPEEFRKWAEEASESGRTYWHIDGTLLRNANIMAHMFTNFERLRDNMLIEPPICYYALHEKRESNENPGADEKKNRLFSILQKLDYVLVQRQIRRLDSYIWHQCKQQFYQTLNKSQDNMDQALRETFKQFRQYHTIYSIVPDMIVNMYRNTYRTTRDNRMPLVIISRDVLLLPVIKDLRSAGFKICLGLLPNHDTDNYFMRQFDCILDVMAFLKHFKINMVFNAEMRDQSNQLDKNIISNTTNSAAA